MKDFPHLPDAELEVMQIIWDKGGRRLPAGG